MTNGHPYEPIKDAPIWLVWVGLGTATVASAVFLLVLSSARPRTPDDPPERERIRALPSIAFLAVSIGVACAISYAAAPESSYRDRMVLADCSRSIPAGDPTLGTRARAVRGVGALIQCERRRADSPAIARLDEHRPLPLTFRTAE